MQAPFADPLSGLGGAVQALPLVGRDTELQIIHLLLKTVALDLPTGARALTISGEMGVGKSRLLAEMYAEARSLGFRVLEGRTYEAGKKFPYLPFFEALRPLLRSSSTERLRYYVGLSSTLSGVDERESEGQQDDAVISPMGMPLVAALARLFPELLRVLGVTIRHEILSPDQEKFRFLDAMATLLERIAQEQPVLLGIDNLQWADSASLELTMYLTVRLHNSPVALVGASRPVGIQERVEEIDNAGAINANGVRALGELVQQGLLLLLPLRPLDTQAAELARHYMLGGNKAAALRWNLLAGEFAARQQAHREAIDHFRLVLRLLEAGETSPQAPSLARLHLSVGELWFKIGELERAAQAFQQSLELLQKPRPTPAPSQEASLALAQVNRLLGDVFRMQGKYDQALAHLQAARTALTFGVEQETTAVPWFPGRSFASTRDVLTIERVSVVERILLLQAQATLAILLYRKKEAETALWQSHQLATEIGDRGSQAFALHLVGWLRGWGEHIHEAIRLQEQAHELYIAIGDPFRAVLGEQGLGSIYQAQGETKRARLYTTRGFERARRYGVRYSLGWLHWNFGTIALTIADWESSNTHLQEAMREAEATNNARLKPIVLQALAELNFRQGRWREADGYFQESIQAAVNTEWYPGAIALYGHFLAVTGRREAARVQLDLATAILEPPGYGGDYYIPFLAEGYLHLEANDQATTYVERIRRLRGFMYYGVSVDRILGVVATKSEDWEMAERAFEHGLALCQRADNQPEEAAILYEQARALLMQSRTQAGQNQQLTFQRIASLCELARTIFLQYSMQRAVDLVDTLQEGVRQLAPQDKAGIAGHEGTSHQLAQLPGKHALAERGYHLDLSLTRRELEVLRLVAEGHTDREVAEILVISPRTINRHLSNIYLRLDVPGRAGAVAYAIRRGLV